MSQITVVTLSTGSEELLTLAALRALEEAGQVVLRTQRHPLVRYLDSKGIPYQSLDFLYESCEDFDVFNRAAAVKLLELSRQAPVCYGVADPVMDATVMALHRLKPSDVQVTVLPGVSHWERCLAQLGLQSASVRLHAAEEFRGVQVIPTEPLLLCELHSRECAGDCKLKLLDLMPPDMEITFFEGTAQGGLQRKCLPLCDMDRQEHYDHLTAVYVPAMPMLERQRYDMEDLKAVMARLRGPGGCPWDREQTHESLLTNLLEESFEYIAAVREADIDHMYDELGDVLLQVVFHAEIARQHGEFEMNDVTTAICRKLIERHTHIFGDVKAETATQVLDNWEAIKREKRGITSTGEAMRDVSTGLSTMLRAWKVQHKAAKVGFDFSGPMEALDKVREETEEVLANLKEKVDPEEELGDLLFSIVNLCRLCGKNPDTALFSATDKFIDRFVSMENAIKSAGKCVGDLTLSEMDVYWSSGKQAK
ncbi:MAG: nucleoside triphosphate pyrophosphohydrolase [Clostridiales bacterium]|nr:nucleoside triphosphate pyrophosphohydrolase [Clostridiales bacterium]